MDNTLCMLIRLALNLKASKGGGTVGDYRVAARNQKGQLAKAAACGDPAIAVHGTHTGKIDFVFAEAGGNVATLKLFQNNRLRILTEAGLVGEVVAADSVVMMEPAVFAVEVCIAFYVSVLTKGICQKAYTKQ